MASANAGGEGWIRTSVRLRGQIYSLLPLTTRPPLHRGREAREMAACLDAVNAIESEELSPLASARELRPSSCRSSALQSDSMPPAC